MAARKSEKSGEKSGEKDQVKTWERKYRASVGEDGTVAVGEGSAVVADALAAGYRPTGDPEAKVVDEDDVKWVVWTVPVEVNG